MFILSLFDFIYFLKCQLVVASNALWNCSAPCDIFCLLYHAWLTVLWFQLFSGWCFFYYTCNSIRPTRVSWTVLNSTFLPVNRISFVAPNLLTEQVMFCLKVVNVVKCIKLFYVHCKCSFIAVDRLRMCFMF